MEPDPIKVLILGGSIRARYDNRDAILALAHEAKDLADYKDRTGRFLDQGHALANSEILAGAAIMGAHAEGAEVDYFPLVHLFPPKDEAVFKLKNGISPGGLSRLDTLAIDAAAFRQLVASLESSAGVVLSTPVYFGDRSSVANKFLQIGSVYHFLKDKIFGMASVGAKRNGGQETAIVFGLYEALTQGALVVGNGPPTSQYGGTALGGNMGQVLEDAWGLETALGTGRRVAQVAKIARQSPPVPETEKVRIAIFVAIDTKEKMLRGYLDQLVQQAAEALPWAEFFLSDLIDHRIYRCLGCTDCPQDKGKAGSKPHCLIEDPTDYVEEIREVLRRSDGAIIAGLNIHEAEELIFRYQVVTERMRFIRRNDFELTNLLFTGLCYHQFGATINPIHSLKTMVSYLRHNAIIHRPVEIYEYDGRLLDSGLKALLDFCQSALRIKFGKERLQLVRPTYESHGKGNG